MIERLQKIDFARGWKTWFAISGVLLIFGLGAIALGNLNFGIDFQGGAQFTATAATNDLAEDELRQQLPPYVRQEAIIQRLGGEGYEVRTPVVEQQQSSEVREAIAQALGAEVSVNSISPSFGDQLRNDALSAIAASLIIVVVFITVRFEFGYALAAMAALFHDIFITVGFYAIVGREVNLVTVVAVLTVLGYSLYDTIIIFDRIRENTPALGYRRERFENMVNLSIRQVVRRSIYTSISTLIPVLALLIFGESVLSDFAFALLVGIAAGTYSSIFIASPVLCLYKAWSEGRKAERERTAPARRPSDEPQV
ncbi:Protein-export membrane protein SecF [Rubrobacter radiotolerans]|uniref:Protein-export membrane protein SecF n=1 Tax=Rubrobacter radiotolerans TaxID=42256 RepID=A0A023X2E5_RUBRA|nr:protein translocase subunit SecF [Rubrobacter radiotolerans]AHY46612.1 Protein-export membrane protein SecF [Rubrobacter radiotolerans]MDX5894019.1 protein translocase subunit SecF [Rubrobacter radiotolerans]SMC04988.1 protein translocase subunit secF [Rubrobacter radiotolerans DSM 5868]